MQVTIKEDIEAVVRSREVRKLRKKRSTWVILGVWAIALLTSVCLTLENMLFAIPAIALYLVAMYWGRKRDNKIERIAKDYMEVDERISRVVR